MKQRTKRGRPKKAVKYVKTINVRFTQTQWLKILNEADKAKLEVSVYIRKTLLDYIELKDSVASKSQHT
jgi:hypothetical protein